MPHMVENKMQGSALNLFTQQPSTVFDDTLAAAHEGLLALSVGVGLGVLAELMAEEVSEVVGPMGRYDTERSAVRHGREVGEVTVGGRRVPIERPRVRAADGSGEMALSLAEASAWDCSSSSRAWLARTSALACCPYPSQCIRRLLQLLRTPKRPHSQDR